MKQHLHTLKTLLVGALTLGLLHTPFAITANDETIDTVEQVDIATVGPNTPYPIMFVTQPPIGEDFVTINSMLTTLGVAAICGFVIPMAR